MRALAPQVLLYPLGTSIAPSLAGSKLALAYHPTHEAFGDGSHPTTRLCAGALDWMCRQRPPSALLDVGTGTGVLARIARARGAARVVATDIDPLALASARAHADLDRSPVPISVSAEAPDHWGAAFDFVVANLLEGPLRELAPAIANALTPGGRLLISGFTPLQSPGLRLAYEAAGLQFLEESRLEGWALLAFGRAPAREAIDALAAGATSPPLIYKLNAPSQPL